MKTKFIITTIVCAVPALLLGRVIWPDPAVGAITPVGVPFLLFVFLAAAEAALFGIGFSFILFGWRMLQKVMPQDRRGVTLVFLSIAWLLVSWWPHDNLHRQNGLNISGLLKIDYGFHLTIMLASLVVAYYFWKYLKRSANEI